MEYSFIHVNNFSHQIPSKSGSSERPVNHHVRSLSSVPTNASVNSSAKPRPPLKSTSTSHLPHVSLSQPDDELSTLPDPRSRTMTPSNDGLRASPSHHPDLNDEVATLSTKLINAINHQTVLDDTLSATRHELHSAKDRIRELEAKNASQREMLAGDVWIRKSSLETEKRAMQEKVEVEIAKRAETEKEKKKIEQELENLTAALFEEANQMVIRAKEEAKLEHDVLQRKNDQIKAQLADSEALLQSQQEQLSQLKHVMEGMVSERDDQTNVTAPSSPGFAKFEAKEDEGLPDDCPAPSPSEAMSPVHPTALHHLLQPVLRVDLASYDDFVTLARLSRKRASSRVSSGSAGGLGALSQALGGSLSSAHQSNGSTSSLNNATFANGSAPQSPNTPASVSSAAGLGIPIPSLRETRFYKRVLAEDIEPTLRLDAAPGLSWLARRTVLNSMTEGSLVVEPIPTNSPFAAIAKPQYVACALCGENRKDAPYLRNHRFRPSESDSAQRYSLCGYCLGRVRSTCDFLGFLRIVKDGHWRADDDDQEKAAWEESVRLREQMFWSRIGGGVVPANPLTPMLDKSRRPSHDQSKDDKVPTEETDKDGHDKDGHDVSASANETAIEAEVEDQATIREPRTPPQRIDGAKSPRDSSQSLDTPEAESGTQSPKRLSITIPKGE